MAVENVIPDNKSLQFGWSANGSTCPYGFQQKFVPKNPDGTIFDCTGIATATLISQTPVSAPVPAQVSQVITVTTADATGIVVTATPAQMTTFMDNWNQNAGQYMMQGTDGSSNTSIVGKGNLQAFLLP